MRREGVVFVFALSALLVGAILFIFGGILPSDIVNAKTNYPLVILGLALIILGSFVGFSNSRKPVEPPPPN